MNKNIFVFLLLSLCLSSLAYANITDDLYINYADLASGTTIIDTFGTFNGTLQGGMTLDGFNMTFTEPGDYINSTTTDWQTKSISFWYKTTDGDAFLVSKWASTGFRWAIHLGSGTLDFYVDGSGWQQIKTGANDGNWHHVVYTQQGSSAHRFYFDGDSVQNLSLSMSVNTRELWLGGQNTGTGDYTGKMTNFILWENRELTYLDAQELYDNGREFRYYQTENITFEYPYEEIDQLTQTSTVTVSSNSPVTVLSGTFSAVPNTNAYVSYSGNIQPTQIPVGDQECYLEVNGNFVSNSNVSYTGASLNSHKSFYKLSNNFTVTQENNTIAMLCYGSSNKNFDVLNTVINIHNLINTTDYNYTLYSLPGSFSVNNLTNFVPVITGAIPVTGFNTSNTNKSTYVIFDVNNQIEYDITNTAKGYLVVNNFTCPALTRYGAAGETGSSSYICARSLENESLINYTLYFKGDVNVDFQAFIKEIVLEDYEIRNCYINDYDITSQNFTDIDSQNITLDTNTKDIYTIASLSLSPNAINQEAIFRFKIESENGTIMYRDLNVINQSGVSTNQYLFTGLSADTYNVTLQGRINSTVPNTTIVNGSILYMAVGESDLFPNTFTITAKDNLIGTFLSTFRVKDGLDLTTTTGSIEYPKQSGLINLTLIADNYFNYTILNYNTSSNLQFNVTPYPWINFTATSALDSSPVSNFTINCGYGNVTATGTNLLYQLEEPLNNTNITCTFRHPDFANSETNITILIDQINTYDFSVYTLNSVNFNFRHVSNNTLIIGELFTVTLINKLDDTINYQFTNNTGNAYLDLISPSDYLGFVQSDNFADLTFTLIVTNRTTQVKDLYFYKQNDTTKIRYTVIDQLGSVLEGARVSALAFDSNTTTWKAIQECTTSVSGTCSLYLLENNYYRYYVYYQDDVTPKLTTDPELVDYTDRTPFILSLVDIGNEEYSRYDQVTILDFSYDNYDNSTGYLFRLEASFNSDVDQVCQKVYYRMIDNSENIICTNCLNVSGINYCNVTLGNRTYYADAYSIVDSKEFLLKRLTLYFSQARELFQEHGFWISMFFTLVLVFLGLPDPVRALMGGVVGIAFGSLTRFIPVEIQVVIVLFILVIFASSRKRGIGRE